MSIQDEHDIKQKLKHPSAYLEIDEDGEEAKLDGNFTLAELEQIVKVMRNRNTPEFPHVMFCTTEEFLGTETIEKLHKIAEDMQNKMNKTVLDVVENTARSKDK